MPSTKKRGFFASLFSKKHSKNEENDDKINGVEAENTRKDDGAARKTKSQNLAAHKKGGVKKTPSMKASVKTKAELKPSRKKLRAPDPPHEKKKPLNIPKIIEPGQDEEEISPKHTANGEVGKSSSNGKLETRKSYGEEANGSSSQIPEGTQGHITVAADDNASDVKSLENTQNGSICEKTMGNICSANTNNAIQENGNTTTLDNNQWNDGGNGGTKTSEEEETVHEGIDAGRLEASNIKLEDIFGPDDTSTDKITSNLDNFDQNLTGGIADKNAESDDNETKAPRLQNGFISKKQEPDISKTDLEETFPIEKQADRLDSELPKESSTFKGYQQDPIPSLQTDKDPESESFKSSSLSTSLNSLPNNSAPSSCVSPNNQTTTRTLEASSSQTPSTPSTVVVVVTGSHSPSGNSLATDISIDLPEEKSDPTQLPPFYRVQQQNSKYGGLSPPRIRRNSNFTVVERKMDFSSDASTLERKIANSADPVLLKEYEKLKDMFNELQISTPESTRTAHSSKIPAIMAQIALVTKMVENSKQGTLQSGPKATFSTPKKRPALDKYSFLPPTPENAESPVLSSPLLHKKTSQTDSPLTSRKTSRLDSPASKNGGSALDSPSTFRRSIDISSPLDYNGQHKHINGTVSKKSDADSDSINGDDTTPATIPHSFNPLLQTKFVPDRPRSLQAVVHAKSLSYGDYGTSGRVWSPTTARKRSDLGSEKSSKDTAWSPSQVQKPWVTNTLRLGSAAKKPDEKALAYQKIQDEIAIECRRQKELAKVRTSLGLQDKPSPNSLAKSEAESQLESHLPSEPTPKEKAEPKLAETSKFSASAKTNGKSLQKSNTFGNSTKITVENPQAKLSRPSYLKPHVEEKAENKEPVTYVYTPQEPRSNGSVKTRESDRTESPIPKRVVHKLSTRDPKIPVAPEDENLYFIRTGEYIGKGQAQKNDAWNKNVTLVNVNGHQGGPQEKYITHAVIGEPKVTTPNLVPKSSPLTPVSPQMTITVKSPQPRIVVEKQPKSVPKKAQQQSQPTKSYLREPNDRSSDRAPSPVQQMRFEKYNITNKSAGGAPKKDIPQAEFSRRESEKMEPSQTPTDIGHFSMPVLKKVSAPIERTGYQLGSVLEDKETPGTSAGTSATRREPASQSKVPPPPPGPPPPISSLALPGTSSNIPPPPPGPPPLISNLSLPNTSNNRRSRGGADGDNEAVKSRIRQNLSPMSPMDPAVLMAEIKKQKVQLKPAAPIEKLKQRTAHEDLLQEIRNAGGIKSLRKRSAAT